MPLTDSIVHLAVIAAAGALGGMARVWVGNRVTDRLGSRFPWGTLAVNVSGAAIIGILAATLQPRIEAAENLLWLASIVGLLGSYTTVSSFSLQTLTLMQTGGWRRASFNIASSILLCVATAAITFSTTRFLLGQVS